jgi:hypothetical protein
MSFYAAGEQNVRDTSRRVGGQREDGEAAVLLFMSRGEAVLQVTCKTGFAVCLSFIQVLAANVIARQPQHTAHSPGLELAASV